MYLKFTIPILLFCCLNIFGQTNEDAQAFWQGKEAHSIVPLSPEAESFDRVKDIPVNMYDGRLDFKIPLYTVKSGDISLPITLEYEGTAIPVEQESTWVGLNWRLNAGGVIVSRQNMRIPSESDLEKGWDALLNRHCGFHTAYPDGGEFMVPYQLEAQQPGRGGFGANWFHENYRTTSPYNYDSCDLTPEVYDDIFRFQNGEAPEYHAVFCGENITFVWDRLKKEFFQTGIKKNYKIEGIGAQIIITNGSGTRFIFNLMENIHPSDSEHLEVNSFEGVYYLTGIESATGHCIKLNYATQYSYKPVRQVIETYYESEFPGDILFNRVSSSMWVKDNFLPRTKDNIIRSITPLYTVQKRMLTSIEADNMVVKFNANSNRKDLNSNDAKQLDNIKICKKEGRNTTLLKQYNFSYSYFSKHTTGGNVLQDYWTNMSGTDIVYRDWYPNDDFVYLRLRLDRLTEVDSDGVSSKPSWRFNYSSGLPGKNSASQDYWGYYNGKENLNQDIKYHTLLPTSYEEADDGVYEFTTARNYLRLNGADRRQDPFYTSAGMLTGVEYPTGASLSIHYEPNSFTNYKYSSHESSSAPSYLKQLHWNEPTLGDNTSISYKAVPSLSIYQSNSSRYSCPATLTTTQFFLIEKPCWVQINTTYGRTGRPDKLTPWSTVFNLQPTLLYKYIRESIRGQMIEHINGCEAIPLNAKDTINQSNIYVSKKIYLPAGRYQLCIPSLSVIDNAEQITYIQSTISKENMYIKENSYGSGLRVASVKRVDNGTSRTTKYDYSGDRYDTSTGILMAPSRFQRQKLLIYQLQKELDPDLRASQAKEIKYHIVCSNNLCPNKAFVGYSKVTRTIMNNRNEQISKNIYDFYNQRWGNGITWDYIKRIEDPRDGFILSDSLFDANSRLQKVERNNYKIKSIESRKTSAVVENLYYGPNYSLNVNAIASENPWRSAAGGGIMEIYLYPAAQFALCQSSSTTTLHEPSGNVASYQNTVYNTDNCQPKKVTKGTSLKGVEKTTEYLYPSDYNLPWTKLLVDKHINEVPIEKLYTYGSKIVGSQLIKYDSFGQPIENYSKEILSDIPASTYQVSNITNFNTTGYQRWQLSSYDTSTHNLRCTVDAKNLNTVYIWGYKNIYPVAIVRGASLEEVKARISNLSAFENADVPPIDAKTLYQKLSQIKGVLVTTYDYNPYVGIVRICSPNGSTTEYNFDTFQRLIGKKENGILTSSYQYHYGSSQNK